MKDPLLDELWWTGWCQEESLGAVAAEFHQLIELGLGFEAFGHDAHPQGGTGVVVTSEEIELGEGPSD